MRVFLTGATGYVGSAVLDACLRASLSVTALVRDPEIAERLAPRNIKPVLGDLRSPASFAGEAAGCEAIVHTAFDHKHGADLDRQAIQTLLAAGERRVASGRPAAFVYTSGVWVLGDTQGRADEEAAVNPTPLVAWRGEHEQLVFDTARAAGVRAVVLRPGILYGRARGIIGDLVRDAANGLVRVVGDGRNHWPCVYDRDLADLYVRVVTHPDAAGVFHATDEADERVADIVEAIARHLPSPPDVRHMPIGEARTKMGPYADALALDQIVRSARARALGWAPTLHSVTGNVARLFEDLRAAREAAA